MGLCKSGALATTALVDKHLMLPIPDSWVIGEAVTVPAAYAVVIEAFNVRKCARYNSINSILIIIPLLCLENQDKAWSEYIDP